MVLLIWNLINLWRFFAHDDATPAKVTPSSDPFICHTCSGASRCGEETVTLFGRAATSCRHPCLHFQPRHSKAVPLSEFIKKEKNERGEFKHATQARIKKVAPPPPLPVAATGIWTKRDENCFLFTDVRL
jgi:hypothetical protein